MAERILLIEDDPSIQRGLELNLGLEGYAVRCAGDADTGLRLVDAWSPDLVVLDVMLPGRSGHDVCRELRRKGSRLPVLMLSAKGAEMDRVQGLDLGADDYVTKPFGLHELLARIKALLRRARPATPEAAQDILRFADVEVDFGAGEVRRAGRVVETTARELDLLRFFAQREGRVVTRQMILDGVWGTNYFGTERTIDNFINRLRAKLDDASDPQHFVTVRGLGYRFRADGRL